MKIIMILTIILFVSCSTSKNIKDIKNIDDTEHNWRGDNGIEFKE